MSKLNANYKRILSAILAFVTVLTLLPMQAFSTKTEEVPAPEVAVEAQSAQETKSLKITLDGVQISSVELRAHEKFEIVAQGVENAQYQWQILHPEKEDLWVNIYDATTESIPVTLALVGNMLSSEDVAQLRCRATADGEQVYSEAVAVRFLEEETGMTVTVEDAEEVLREESAEEVVEVEEEIIEETTEAVEEVVEETTAPAEAEEELVEEVTAPAEAEEELVEEVTAPAEEAAEAAEEAVEAAEETVETEEVTELIDVTYENTPAQTYNAEPDSDFVTVTIDYVRYDILWENGKMVVDGEGNPVLETEGVQAFTSYIATLQKGTDLNTSVNNPTMVGYDTFLGDAKESSLKVDINLTNITENVTYTVKYKPAKVKYVVRYYLQNIYDDLYAENATLKPMINGEGYTGATPPEDQLQGEVPGFTALYYQPDSIAADGSTIFEVYYERNYYLMEFDCNGGYGAETLYNRYGSYVSVPTPVRPGYVFQGWNLIERGDNPAYVPDAAIEGHLDAIPAYNSAYQAVWTTDVTSYTVVYWRENADDDGYSYWGSRQIGVNNNGTLNGTVHSNDHVSGTNHTAATGLSEAAYFTYNAEKTIYEESRRTDLAADGKVIVEGDGSTVVNVYYSRNVYTLQFNIGNATFTAPADSHVHTDGNCEYKLICGFEDHIHSSECVSSLTCTIPEHTVHTSECIICGKTEHVHGDANCECTLTEHTHTEACCTKEEHAAHTAVSCFTTQSPTLVGTSGDHYNRVRNISNPVAGRVYKYRYRQSIFQEYTYYNYFYDGTNWYYLGINTEYAGMKDVTIDTNDYGWNNVLSDAPTSICAKEIHTHGDGNCNTGADTCPGMEHTHGDGNCNCSKNEHTHDDSCYKDVIHAHTEDCYTWTCGASAHTHTDECYSGCIKPESYVEGTGNNKKYYIKAKYNQTIGDIWPTSANYPGLYGWSVEGNTNVTAVSKKINMTTDLCDTNDGVRVVTVVNQNTNYTVHLYYMFESFDQTSPANGNDRKLYNGVYYDKSTLYYQDAVSTSTEFSQKTIMGMTAVGVDPERITNSEYNNFLYYTRERVDLKFHNINTTVQTVANLMYEYPLKDILVNSKSASTYVPPYPTTYEPGAYEFGGWYTTPQCFPGTEVDWKNGTMPITDLEIYAKWTPIMRNVTFYSSYSAIGEDEKDTSDKVYHFMKATGVPHGTNLGSTYYDIPEWPDDLDRAENGGPESELYDFIGWFYLDEDNKKKFAPDSMEVTRDLVLFAEWNTSIDTTYEVKYVLKNEVFAENVPSKTPYPAGTSIADTDAAHASVGKTKTFTAKGMGDLYPDFQTKFFPTVNSHSILMEPQNTEGSQNKFTFEYVYDDTVYYKVRYVDYATRTELRTAKIDFTDKAVITEKFLPIEGYIPQNFYIRKALAYDGNATENTVIEENVITFYYVRDLEHGLYSIEYYRENVGSAYDPNHADAKKPEYFTQFFTQYESIVGSADLEKTITAEPRTYQGYTFVPEMNTVITYKTDGSVDKTSVGVKDKNNLPYGTVDYTGLTLKLYFTRNEYPYIIKYVESGSNKELKIVESDSEEFDATVTHTAPAEYVDNKGTATTSDDITYEYYLVDSTTEQRTKEMTIRESAAGAENTLIFYYTQKKVEVQYHAVCLDPLVPADMKESMKQIGSVSLNAEKAITVDNLGGSNATAAEGFRFVGWYRDETCQEPVDPSWLVGTTHLKPQALYQDEDWINHYYALFEPVKEDLKIIKTGTGIDEGHTFLFRVTGKNVLGQDVDMIVSIQGAKDMTIKDLYCGDYTVTELTGWSWTYTCADDSQEVTLTTQDKDGAGNLLNPQITTNEVTFTNNSKEVDWLHGESEAAENQFSA